MSGLAVKIRNRGGDFDKEQPQKATAEAPEQNCRFWSPATDSNSYSSRRSKKMTGIQRTLPRTTSLALFSVAVLTIASTRAQDTSNPSSWYKRYSVYPPYCSTPDEMAKRSVPPLQEDSRLGASRLVHVTAIMRHGARTPYKSMPCWKGYNQNPATAVWDCNLTTYTSPPPPDRIQQEEGAEFTVLENEGMFLFEKHYDTLSNPQYNLSNALNGTCQLGQLLMQGYQQEVTNGQHLRDAYVFTKHDQTHDPRLRLLDISGSSSQQNVWDHIYYRVDDDQRTILSGQLVLRGLLGTELNAYLQSNKRYPVLPLHTADRHRDIVDPNEAICPRLTELQERYRASREYRAFNESQEVQTLRHFQTHVLGTAGGDLDAGIDCLMTTICTDRPLPEAIDDYTGGDEDSERDFQPPQNLTDYGSNLFLRLYNYFVKDYVLAMLANDYEYARLSMAPLWAEIMDNINGVVKQEETICCPQRRIPKMAIFSGHDTTIIPLLASLDAYDNKWPSYASMVILEIHNINLDGQTNRQFYTTDYGFRLIYNGKVITHRMRPCPRNADICDAKILIDYISRFATRQPNCTRQHIVPQEHTDTVSRATELLSTQSGIASVVLLVLGSALFGAVGSYLYMSSLPRRGRLRRRKYRAAPSDSSESDGLALSRMDSGEQRYSDTVEDASSSGAEEAAINATLT